MNHKFQLKRVEEGHGNPVSVFIGLVFSIVAVLVGGVVAVYSWAPVSVGMGSNTVPFVLGTALIITGLLFYLMIRVTDRYIY